MTTRGLSQFLPTPWRTEFGRRLEIVRASPIFDPDWYRAAHFGPEGGPSDCARDYLKSGWREGRDPHPLFDSRFYLEHHPDLASTRDVNPFVHFLVLGGREPRLVNPLFDVLWYRTRYPDVWDLGAGALTHFMEFGATERRDPHPLFDSHWYAVQPPSLDDPAANLLLHYLRQGRNGDRDPHPLFDRGYYLGHSRAARRSDLPPLVHYLHHNPDQVGPNAYFDDRWYLERNPDVRRTGVHPLIHFVTSGAREGRDPSPGFSLRWYLDENPDVKRAGMNPLVHYLHYGRAEGRRPRPVAPANAGVDLKALHNAALELRLQAFLASSARLRFKRSAAPVVSILIVLFNKAQFTFACLESLQSALQRGAPSEIVVLDNASTDDTGALLDRCDNLTVLRNGENLGFLEGVNRAAKSARGEHLLLLNNDTQVPHGSIERALAVLEGARDIGAVGARLILPDGRLQEAGSIVWSDGSCVGYARGRDPDHFEANFRRDVDYCSGAFLLTPRALFERLGGFDARYKPAYYEETDYCLRLWESGFRVVYDPAVVLFHFEFASSGGRADAAAQMARNQKTFFARHKAALARRPPPDAGGMLFARSAGPVKPRILVIDDKVPHESLGSGFPRARTILARLVALGAAVTLFTTDDRFQSWAKVRRTLDPSVEVVFGLTRADYARFLSERRGFYRAVVVSRPDNMRPLNEALETEPDLLAGARLVYDAEAIFTDREVLFRQIRGEPMREAERERMLADELAIARFASTVLCVSKADQRRFQRLPGKDVRVLGHALVARPSAAPFEARRDLLFVGAVHRDDSPNADSLVWFVDEVMPLLRQSLGPGVRLVIAGVNGSERVRARLGEDVVALGPVDDLGPVYARARVFVAPTRYAAGIPHKVHEAAAAGLPCVVTPVLAAQLGWREGTELLRAEVAAAFATACKALYEQPELWTRVRDGAARAVARDCDPSVFAATLDALCDEILERRPRFMQVPEPAAGDGPYRPPASARAVGAFATEIARG